MRDNLSEEKKQEVQSRKALDRLSQQIEYFTVLINNVRNKDTQFQSAVETLEELKKEIRKANEHGLGEADTSMSLLKRLILDTKVKLQVMAEDSRLGSEVTTSSTSSTTNSTITSITSTSTSPSKQATNLTNNPNTTSNSPSKQATNPTSITTTITSNTPQQSTAMHLTNNSSERPCDDSSRVESGNSDKESTGSSTAAKAQNGDAATSIKAVRNGEPTPSAGDRVSPASSGGEKTSPGGDKVNDSSAEKETAINGEVKIMRPPSPIPGPSSKPDFVVDSDKTGGNVATRLRLENERLKREVSELRKLVSASGVTIPTSLATNGADHDQEDLVSRVQSLEDQLIQAKETISAMKADRKKLKAEKCDLVNQMKQLYATLEDKEKELRDFIRSFEQKMRDQDECLNLERADRERERWSLLKQARDEAERSLSLAAQLDLKQQQLLDARRALSSGGCLSDQESASGWRGVNGGSGVPGDRTSGSVDSGLRGSSDRQSTANLSDSTTEGTPTVTVEATNQDFDSISLLSSYATTSYASPHIYQSITTPKECSSPSLSPLNAHSFSRSLDSSNLSRSVEQLSSPQMEVEPLRRGKLRGSGGSASSAKSTWGSISRVFARSKHRNKITSPNSQDDGSNEIYGRSWSPLTEEGYAEKLRLLREASSIPMERWRAPTVLAWLEISLGMPQYGPRCAQNIKSGKVLLELSDVELEVGLGIQHPMHRKKLRLAIEEHRHPGMVRYPSIGQLGHTWVASEWLPDLGLPQYSENFATNLVDARMLDHLSKKELEKYLGVTRKFHQASIVHGIHLLRMMKYDRQALAVRRHQCENVEADPLVWTNQRFIRWVRNIDLGEYCENLKDSGVHGALVVLEPSFNGDTMATALGVPQSRNMIRRHLAAELEALVLPARAGFEQGYMRPRRSHGGSLGRGLSKIQSRALPPPPPIQERTTTPENRRATSFRGSLSKAFSSSRSSSKTNSRCEDNMDRLSPVSAREATSPTWSEDGLLRPDSPQSAITLGRKPTHRHRRVKSIGDIDTIRNTTAV